MIPVRVRYGCVTGILWLQQSLIHGLIPFHWHGLTLLSTWISNYIHYKMWDEIMYPFQTINFQVSMGQLLKFGMECNFSSHFTEHVITYPCWDWKWYMLVKGALGHHYLQVVSIITYFATSEDKVVSVANFPKSSFSYWFCLIHNSGMVLCMISAGVPAFFSESNKTWCLSHMAPTNLQLLIEAVVVALVICWFFIYLLIYSIVF